MLAQSGEVFSSLPSALPTFDQWLNYSAGVNINKTIEVGTTGSSFVPLFPPLQPRCMLAYASVELLPAWN